MTGPDETIIDDVLDFWFGPPGSEQRGQPRKEWFVKNPDFDRAIRDRFAAQVDRALAGELDGLAASRNGALALVVMLDQFTRNIHRGAPEAFAGDDRALATARAAIVRGWDRVGPVSERSFFYLPFEHCEDMAVQEESLRLFASLEDAEPMKWAKAHYDIIARFGRYPHRNAILGRENTAEETEFLTQPGSGF